LFSITSCPAALVEGLEKEEQRQISPKKPLIKSTPSWIFNVIQRKHYDSEWNKQIDFRSNNKWSDQITCPLSKIHKIAKAIFHFFGTFSLKANYSACT
jgi:hypothetical protein